jgi:hypothetical protein
MTGITAGKKKQHADFVITLANLVGQETEFAPARKRAAFAGGIV